MQMLFLPKKDHQKTKRPYVYHTHKEKEKVFLLFSMYFIRPKLAVENLWSQDIFNSIQIHLVSDEKRNEEK